MLSKNEQIVVYIMAVLVIGIAGVLLFVMPNYKKIAVNQGIYDQKATELEDLKTRLSPAVEKELDEKIQTAYTEGDKVSESFYKEMTEYEADRTLREFLGDVKDPYDYTTPVNINTDNMEIEGLKTSTFTVDLPKDKGVTYSIKEKSVIDTSIYGATPETVEGAADESQNLSDDLLILTMLGKTREEASQFYEENKDKYSPGIQEAMRQVLAGTSETVAVQSLTFTMPLTPSEVNAIGMHALKSDKAIYIQEISREDLEEDTEEGGEIEPITISAGGEDELEVNMIQDKYLYSITLAFYCVQRLDKPNFQN